MGYPTDQDFEEARRHRAPPSYRQPSPVDCAIKELEQARANWPKFNSAHEGFAVLREEVDELWEHVKTNQKRRDLAAMKKEAIQVAAMALRFAEECCDETVGRK
jgi:NTP pyrophosphatase (non-canonical NTP hydrolase)